MIDISNNPRVTQLLGRIEETERLLAGLPQDDPTRAALAASVDDWYQTIGRYVHWMVRQTPESLARVQEEARLWAAAVDEQIADGGVTSSVELTGSPEPDAAWRPEFSDEVIPLMDEDSVVELGSDSIDGGIDRRDLGDVRDQSASVSVVIASMPGEEERPAEDLVELASLTSGDGELESNSFNTAALFGLEVSVSEPSGVVADEPSVSSVDEAIALDDQDSVTDDQTANSGLKLQAGGNEGPGGRLEDAVIPAATTPADHAWMGALRDLLDMVGGPDAPAESDADLLNSANRLLNSTTNMNVRWLGFPERVQRALLGYLATRARHLQTQMSVDVEVRLTLGRLKRFHSARGLPELPALDKHSEPNLRSWDVESRRWWDRLRGGA